MQLLPWLGPLKNSKYAFAIRSHRGTRFSIEHRFSTRARPYWSSRLKQTDSAFRYFIPLIALESIIFCMTSLLCRPLDSRAVPCLLPTFLFHLLCLVLPPFAPLVCNKIHLFVLLFRGGTETLGKSDICTF